jgi:archaellum component FlaC
MTIWEKKKEREEKLKGLLEAGKVTQGDYESELKNIDKWMNTQRNNLSDKIDMMIGNHAKQIQKTLELFTERTLREH